VTAAATDLEAPAASPAEPDPGTAVAVAEEAAPVTAPAVAEPVPDTDPPLVAEAPALSVPDQVRAVLPSGLEARLPGWTVVWAGNRPGYLAVTDPATHTITMYQRPGDSVGWLAFNLAHEYGHALDLTYLTPTTRAQWGQRRGFATTTWFPCPMCSDFATPAGDWAESVAVCFTGNPHPFQSRLAGPPTGDDCAWIAATVGV
jgi:hypothetical protein